MSDDDVPGKKSLVGLALVIGLGIWIGVSGELFDLPGMILGWCLWIPVLVLFSRWKPS